MNFFLEYNLCIRETKNEIYVLKTCFGEFKFFYVFKRGSRKLIRKNI